MRFSHKDKKDDRVIRQSTYAFDFPEKLDQAPVEQGVFVLLNETSDVLYVGCTIGNTLQIALAELVGKPSIDRVVSYRWFITKNEKIAKVLAMDWLEKYQPKNQPL